MLGVSVMFQSKPKFDANKCKVQLKMLINRLNLLSQKKGNLAKAEKRKVAELLRDTKRGAHHSHYMASAHLLLLQ